MGTVRRAFGGDGVGKPPVGGRAGGRAMRGAHLRVTIETVLNSPWSNFWAMNISPVLVELLSGEVWTTFNEGQYLDKVLSRHCASMTVEMQ